MMTLLLVDDAPATRRALRRWLEIELDAVVVGEAGDGATALALARALQPTVIVMEIALPTVDGITALVALRTVAFASPVVVHSIYDDPMTRAQVRDAGAVAFVAKHAPHEQLLDAVRQAALRRVGSSQRATAASLAESQQRAPENSALERIHPLRAD